jgi:hypothetical protein
LLKKFSRNDHEYFENVFGYWWVGAFVGTMIGGVLNMTVAMGFREGVLYDPSGLLFGKVITVCFAFPLGGFSALVGVPFALGVWGGLAIVRHFANKAASKMSLMLVTPLLSLLRFRIVICGGCLQYTNPMKSHYENGVKYCEHCQKEVEYTKDPGKVIVTFGYPLEAEGRTFMLSDPNFEQKDQPIDVSEVYIDTTTCNRRMLERFVTYIVNYPPKHGIRSVRIFYQGNLADLGESLKNALHNTFVQVEQMG